MAHLRQQIRDVIKTVFSNLTIDSEPIFISYDSPDFLQEEDLPAICMLFSGEDIEEPIIGSKHYLDRTFKLAVNSVIKQNDNLQNKSDDLAVIVEKKMFEATTALKTAQLITKCSFNSVEADFEQEQEKSQSVLSHLYIITYRAKQSTPDVAFN